MSLGCRTRGRRNSWVIQIHLSLSLSLPPHFRPALLPFLRCDQEVVPPCPRRAAENPSPEPRARMVHSSKVWPSPARDSTPWANELGVWCGRTVRVTPLHTGEGIFTYYGPSRHIKRTGFEHKERSLSVVPDLRFCQIMLVFFTLSLQDTCFVSKSFINFPPTPSRPLS